MLSFLWFPNFCFTLCFYYILNPVGILWFHFLLNITNYTEILRNGYIHNLQVKISIKCKFHKSVKFSDILMLFSVTFLKRRLRNCSLGTPKKYISFLEILTYLPTILTSERIPGSQTRLITKRNIILHGLVDQLPRNFECSTKSNLSSERNHASPFLFSVSVYLLSFPFLFVPNYFFLLCISLFILLVLLI